MKKCRICGNRSLEFGSERFKRWKVVFSECVQCAYIQANDLEWLEDAYKTPINVVDTGIMVRNIKNVNEVLACLSLVENTYADRVADMAGGYGILTRLLRDVGVEAKWKDEYTSNLCARGFEYKSGRVDLVTAFEVFEHFVDPLTELRKMLDIGKVILVSTELAPLETPDPHEWWYYGLEHGQHIGFFRKRTLETLARICDIDVISDGRSIHVFLPREIPFWKRVRYRIFRKFPLFLLRIGYRSKTIEDYRSLSINAFR